MPGRQGTRYVRNMHMSFDQDSTCNPPAAKAKPLKDALKLIINKGMRIARQDGNVCNQSWSGGALRAVSRPRAQSPALA